ncbi:MAG: dephospho-CoA kinase [Gammaproteobacteria bacterium]|nr:dephospho-CoA kinase [Gammaproteobacteria bacterium]
MTVIGLTGGIASGKSTLSSYAREHGAHIIDADVLGHRAYEPGTACYDAVVSEFGKDIVADDGSIDRRILSGKVFAEGSSLERLTDIVWPAIKAMAQSEIEDVKRNDPNQTIVLEAAVLLEAGWQDFVDVVWVAVVDFETAIERTIKRDGMDREAVQNRIDAQLSNEERIAAADVVFDNSGTEGELMASVKQKLNELEARSAA